MAKISINSIYHPRNIQLARKAKRWGMQNSLRTVVEARKAGIPVALAFAMVEKESGNGANVFGHDPTIYAGAGKVTKAKYLDYKRLRGHYNMQGVGPLQLTWWSTQDAADKLGGCWNPRYNLQQGFQTLHNNIQSYGKHAGIRAYNGAGPRAEAYANSVEALERKWHKRLY
jgi:hypothetical protein